MRENARKRTCFVSSDGRCARRPHHALSVCVAVRFHRRNGAVDHSAIPLFPRFFLSRPSLSTFLLTDPLCRVGSSRRAALGGVEPLQDVDAFPQGRTVAVVGDVCGCRSAGHDATRLRDASTSQWHSAGAGTTGGDAEGAEARAERNRRHVGAWCLRTTETD